MSHINCQCLPTPPSRDHKKRGCTSICVTPPPATHNTTSKFSALASACLPTPPSNRGGLSCSLPSRPAEPIIQEDYTFMEDDDPMIEMMESPAKAYTVTPVSSASSAESHHPMWCTSPPSHQPSEFASVQETPEAHEGSHQHGDNEREEPGLHPSHSRRGKHTRTHSMGKRTKWVDQVQAYVEDLKTARLIANARCSPSCKLKACNQLIDLRTAKLCAQDSFGDAAINNDWSKLRGNHETIKLWFHMAHGHRVLDPQTKLVSHIDYKLQGVPVCQGSWASFLGIKPATALSIH